MLVKMNDYRELILSELANEIGAEFVTKKRDEILNTPEMKKLLEEIEERGSSYNYKRLKEFKMLLKKVKMMKYYETRKFRTDGGLEVSILERGQYLEQLIERLTDTFKMIGGKVVLDIGSGTFPLYFSKELPAGTVYIAIDSRKEVIEELNKASTSHLKLIVIHSDACEIDYKSLLSQFDIKRADITLMLRVLSVIARTKKIDPVEFIESIPTRTLVVSEPLRSLVRKESVITRETKFLNSLARKLENRGIFAYHEIWTIGEEIFLFLF
jgi:hypothetical protein